MTSLETTDIFRGAFLLCMGGNLSDIRIRNNGRRIAAFLITGKDVDKRDREYRTGHARVNPLQLRESLNHLRDAMFEKLQEAEGRYDYDRERHHRHHKGRYRNQNLP